MATETRSPREIERDIEAERTRLRETVDEAFNRLTFEDAWNRAGLYMRDNRSEFGQSLGKVMRERPVGVALTAIGLAWLFFGPKSNVEPRGVRYGRHEPDPRDFETDPLARERDPVGGPPAARSAYASPTTPARPASDTARTGSSDTRSGAGSHSSASHPAGEGVASSFSPSAGATPAPSPTPSPISPTAAGKPAAPTGDAAKPGASVSNKPPAIGASGPGSTATNAGPKTGSFSSNSTTPASKPATPASDAARTGMSEPTKATGTGTSSPSAPAAEPGSKTRPPTATDPKPVTPGTATSGGASTSPGTSPVDRDDKKT
ncbi:DUF3618 domain-containing protein [Tranquillimonas alkanivorans]|uniref:DUF3618 domain-containing protein n=1 Tax=Tranquillimonas alkanivorans TaxID=441119 RepID=A0A1I5WRU8_9RHOB|nr:DUF3618 domain-containing protein [Tranquillimonas alkanivorans]SFQ22247.1 Protein of unknown function [Tranquillimonas alkanivorans]